MTEETLPLKDKAYVSTSTQYHQQIQRQLQKILSTRDFQATKQQCDLLRFVVSETLAGRADYIKGYAIATKVLNRPKDFEPALDPIVSIQANKLRRALERYYLVEGIGDSIKIDIPKGAYVPTFTELNIASDQKTEIESSTDPDLDTALPGLLISSIRNNTSNIDLNYICAGLSAELAIEISKFEHILVYHQRDCDPSKISPPPSRFVLKGDIYNESKVVKLGLRLIDYSTGTQIWGETCHSANGLRELYRFKNKVVPVIASQIAGEFGTIPKILRKETKHKQPSELTTYEAILRYWQYEQCLSPETFIQAFEALTQAQVNEPDCPQVLGSLAALYNNIFALGIPGFTDPLEKAIYYAEKAAAINPNNQRNLTMLAYVRFTSGELQSAIYEANQAFEINPNSLFMLDAIGWLLTLSGEWDLGPRLAEKAITLNPCHRAIAHDALWVNHLRQEEFDLAYKQACARARHSTLFWDPLIRASTAGILGKDNEAGEFATKLLSLRPDFPLEGRTLISKFIKFDDIAERIIAGLTRAGLEFE
jgi:TolB-like protein